MQDEILKENETMEEFAEFKRRRREEEARQYISKLECDLASPSIDKNFLKNTCATADSLGIGAVCVLPCFVKACVNFLGKDPKTSLIALVSSPHGSDTTKVKVVATKCAVKDGVDEVEFTAPVPQIKNANWGYVKREFKKVKAAARGRAVRVNVEAPLLTAQELAKTCGIAADAGLNCIVVASGTYGAAADEQALGAVKAAVKDKCLIKVNGAETYLQTLRLTDMGAALVGAKDAVEIARAVAASAREGSF